MATSKNRRLAAILFADIVGYTALMQTDEPQALFSLQKFKTALEKQVPAHKGEVIQFYGDGCLAVFDSSVDAVTCAQNLQLAFQTAPTVPVRIGLHAGDVVFRDKNVFGDAVNIASRVESMGVPGAVLLSSSVRNQIKNQPEFELMSLGRFEFKNVQEGMTVYALTHESLTVPQSATLQGKFKAKSPPTKKLNWQKITALLGIGFLLLAGFLWWNGSNSDKLEKEALALLNKQSIGVLPFTNMSEDSQLDYFNSGIREEVVTQLIRLKDLNVFSAEVANQYKDSHKSPIEIGKEMQVQHLLIGTTRMDGNQKVVGTKLLEVNTGKYLWADSFKESELPIASFQNEIAKLVSISLKLELSPRQQQRLNKLPTNSEEAYDLYLRSQSYSLWSVAEAEEGIELLEKAIELDANFSRAYSALALFNWGIASTTTQPPIPYWLKAKEMAQMALKIDTENAHAWEQLGIVQHNFDWDMVAADESFQKAIDINPKRRLNYANFLLKYKQPKAAFKEIQLGLRLNPENPRSYEQWLALAYIHSNQLTLAKKIIDNLQLENRTSLPALLTATHYYLFAKNYQGAIPIAKKIRTANRVKGMAFLGYLYGKTGNQQTAQNYLDSLTQIATSNYVSPVDFAYIHFGMNDKELGFKALQQAYTTHDADASNIDWVYVFDEDVRTDPRFLELLKLVGLPTQPKG